MKVISVSVNGGFFGELRRRQGDVFNIPDTPRRTPSEKEAKMPQCKEAMDKNGTVPESFSSLWMRRAPKGTPEKLSVTPPASLTGTLSLDEKTRRQLGSPSPATPAGEQDAGEFGNGGPDEVL